MPYFDGATYAVGDYLHAESEYRKESENLKRMAASFLERCEDRGYPWKILHALQFGLATEDRNLLVIMADATTKFAIHMKEAFAGAWDAARTRGEQYNLLCIMFTALFTYRWGPIDPESVEAYLEARKRYDDQYGKDDLLFLDDFFKVLQEEHREQNRAEREMLVRQERVRRENAARQQALIDQRKAERAAEIERNREAQKAQQKERSAKRQAELEAFRQKPLAEQLETVLSDRRPPDYYGIDYGAISEEAMRTLPRAMLVRIVTSFLNVRAAGWKQFQSKAKALLAEETSCPIT